MLQKLNSRTSSSTAPGRTMFISPLIDVRAARGILAVRGGYGAALSVTRTG